MKTLENYPRGKPGEVFVCPSGVKDVEEDAFNGNRYLKHIYFQEGVKGVGSNALQDQPLESVSFPSSFTSSGYFCLDAINSKLFIAMQLHLHQQISPQKQLLAR